MRKPMHACRGDKSLVAVSMFLLAAILAWSAPVPGSLDVHWKEGAQDCSATPQEPVQVHQYEPQTFILRQNPCADLLNILGEEFLWRGVVLPRQEVAFGRRAWVVNGILWLLFQGSSSPNR
jgi:Type II CAAX prenyl endopeptidase Rce1-like